MGCAGNSVDCVYITASWVFFKWHKELLLLGHAAGLVLILQNLVSRVLSGPVLSVGALLSCLSLLWSLSHSTSQ